MWLTMAFLSALAASLVAIFGKLGLKNIDSTLATTIRSIIMALFLTIVSLFLGKWNNFSVSNINSKDWLLITLAGIAGALSWLFYFFALKTGEAAKVVAIDRLSIVLVVILAALLLKETVGIKTVTGAILMVAGAILISMK